MNRFARLAAARIFGPLSGPFPTQAATINVPADHATIQAGINAAIRAARKAYQTDGTMPDWEAVWQLIETVPQHVG